MKLLPVLLCILAVLSVCTLTSQDSDSVLSHCALGSLDHNKTGMWTVEGTTPPPIIHAIGTRAAKIWAAAGHDVWSTAAAWAPAGVPGVGDSVTFDATSVFNCIIDVDTNALTSFNMAAGYTGIVSILGVKVLSVTSGVAGDFTGTQGTFNAGTGVINVNRHWDTSAAAFIFNRGTSTVNLTGTGNLKLRNSTTYSFHHVTLAAATKTTTVTGDAASYGTLTTGAGILTGTALWYLRTVTAPLVVGGMVSVDISIVYTLAPVNVVSTAYGKDLYIVLSINTATLAGDVTVGRSLYIYGETATTSTLNTAGYSVTITQDLQLGWPTTARQGVMICGASLITVGRDLLVVLAGSYITGNTSQWSIGRHINNDSTSANMALTGTTFTFIAVGAQTVAMNGDAFGSIVFPSAGIKSFTESFGSAGVTTTVDITMTITTTATWTIAAASGIYAGLGRTLTISSSVAGTFFTTVAGAGVTATRVDVRDSDNGTGTAIDATDGTNVDSGHNINWNFYLPTVPALAGPISGYNDYPYDYTAVSTDADPDTIRYTFDWDDGTTTTTGYFASGVVATAAHTWVTGGYYHVIVRAQDEHGAVSAWSGVLTVFIEPYVEEEGGAPGLRAPIPSCVYNALSNGWSCTDIQDYGGMKVLWVTWQLDGGRVVKSSPNGRVDLANSDMPFGYGVNTHVLTVRAYYASGAVRQDAVPLQSNNTLNTAILVFIVLCILVLAYILKSAGKGEAEEQQEEEKGA